MSYPFPVEQCSWATWWHPELNSRAQRNFYLYFIGWSVIDSVTSIWNHMLCKARQGPIDVNALSWNYLPVIHSFWDFLDYLKEEMVISTCVWFVYVCPQVCINSYAHVCLYECRRSVMRFFPYCSPPMSFSIVSDWTCN